MKYQEAMEYIESCAGYGIVPGLDSIRELLFRLGNPERELSFIHIAGTNGKGSTLFFLSNILATNGYKTGRYLSPTIFEYRERFQMNGKPISKAAFGRLVEVVAEAAESMAAEGHPHPTPFEIDTALAFLYFKEKNCDFVVLETGLGGLMDATNVVENTLVTVLTSISRDHMGFLGESLSEIAEQKAGIIKKDSYVVALEGEPEVEEVIVKTAKERQAKEVTFVHPGELRNCRYGLEKQKFSYKDYKQMEITLAGQYQLTNAALALEAVETLKQQGISFKEEKIRQGLAVGKWPARFQILRKKPYFIVDGAHNEGAARELRRSLEFYFTNKRILYIMGMFRDKECAKVVDLTYDLAEHIITVQAKGNSRALPALELATLIAEKHPQVTVADSVEEAVELSLLLADKDTVIVAFGSLAYLGDCIRAVEQKGVKFMVDKEKIKAGVRLLLEGMGEDVNREGLQETPDRIARMYEEIFGGMEETAATHLAKRFTVEDAQMVLEKDIVFYSMCEHHLMPFYGKAHVAYIPGGEVVGLSKLARTVEVFAKRPQLQERMTAQIADAIMKELSPQGVMVVVEAEHMCMTMRGIKKPGSKTVTQVTRGCFEEEKLQNQFYRMLEA